VIHPFTCNRNHSLVALSFLALVACAAPAVAQTLAITATGKVEAVYLSTNISEPVFLVQLQAEKIALNDNASRPRGIQLPESNETLFIACAPGTGPLSSRTSLQDLPQLGSEIRAQIVSNAPGQWVPATANWFENTPPATTTATRSPAPADPGDATSPQVDLRGMLCEAIILEGHLAFKVKSISPSGPAHDAGFQVGDIVLAVGGTPLSSVAALKDFAAKPTPLKLSVVDVNTGQLAQVDLDVATTTTSTPPEGSSPTAAADPAGQIAKALGVEVTEARIGFRKSALAVAKVDPLGAAAESGIEVGDLIVAVNDSPTASIPELVAALPANGGNSTILVRDVRGGEDVPVEVKTRPIGAGEQPRERPQSESPASTGAGDALGIATELAFYKGEAAVRITGVDRGSPAARAGLQAGLLILAVDGKPVMHPDELKAAEKSNANRLRLRVADPRAGREAEVDITR
jgi:S1-C subfamily serine protease